MASLELLKRFVAPEVPGCPSAIILNKIVTKTIEFCEKSESWRYDFSAIDIVANQSHYVFTIPEGTQVVGIKTLFDNGQPVHPKSEKLMDTEYPRLNTTFGQHTNPNNSFEPWRLRTESQAVFYFQDKISSVRLFPIPATSKTGGLTGTLVLKPLPDGNVIDDDLYSQFYDAIASGAKSDLMAMPDKQWSSPELVSFYKDKFEQGIIEARGKEARSNQVTNKTTGRVRSWS